MAITDSTSLTSSFFNVPMFMLDTLAAMEQRLQMVGLINRQIEKSRGEFQKGSVVNLRKASTFTVQRDAFANLAAIEQAKPEDVTLTIDQYVTAGMRMNDVEEAIVGKSAWDRHTRRIGYACAAEVEREVTKLALKVPHTIRVPISTYDTTLLTKTNRIFTELGVPEDGAQLRRYAANPMGYEKWLNSTQFSQNQGAGQTGVATQTSGDLPDKFGLTPYQSTMLRQQPLDANLPSGGSETAAAVAGAAIVSGNTRGSKTVTLTYTGLAAPTVFSPGQVIQLATTADSLLPPTAGEKYRRQLYAVESSGAVSGGNIAVTLTQALRQDHAGTWRRIQLAAADAAYCAEVAYYADAFALCMVDLPMDRPGVQMFTATNPNSGLSLRGRFGYEFVTMQAAFIIDGYFGVKCIDPDKAIRIAVDLNA